jgi:multiple sugar transport system permease protein
MIAAREATPQDTKSGLYFAHYANLRGTVLKVYGDEAAIQVDPDSLPGDIRARHHEGEQAMRQRWLDNLSEAARGSLSDREKAFRLNYAVLVALRDLRPDNGQAAPAPEVAEPVSQAGRAQARAVGRAARAVDPLTAESTVAEAGRGERGRGIRKRHRQRREARPRGRLRRGRGAVLAGTARRRGRQERERRAAAATAPNPMSHIARVGRRSWRVRVGVGVLYVVLVLGAITTVYPFLLMVSTAAKSQTDYINTFEVPPRYLFDERTLYAKYLEDRYANNLDELNAAHGAAYAKFAEVAPPAGADTFGARTLARDWATFVRGLPDEYKRAGFGEHDNAPSLLLLRYRDHLRTKFLNNINTLNEVWTEENVSFDTVTPPFERTARREYVPEETPKRADWVDFSRGLPPHFLIVQRADPLYQRFLREERYDDDLARLNAAWGAQYAAWHEIPLPPKATDTRSDAERADWEAFLRTKYPLRLLFVSRRGALLSWRAFLAARGRPDAATAEFPLPLPAQGQALTDWMEFVRGTAPLDALGANSAENQWRHALQAHYGTIEEANADLGTRWTRWADAMPPQSLVDWRYTRDNAGALRGEFATRNFRAVAGYIFLHGRAVLNTVIFCVLAILAAVTVNPLCAYALSRYNLPYAYKVLLFLLATMAFPAEVAMIPNFLLLRDLGCSTRSGRWCCRRSPRASRSFF